MKIVVLAGGFSDERDVSLSSGSMIANALMEKGHSICLLDVYEGMELTTDSLEKVFIKKEDGKTFSYVIPDKEPDLEELRKKNQNQQELIGKNVLKLCKAADVVFIALHGAMGENGQLQATLENMNIPYTGSHYAGCLLAMDKDLTKQLLCQAGIPTGRWFLYDSSKESIEDLKDKVSYPCVLKPVSNGSSIGVSILNNEDELMNGIAYGTKYEKVLLVEEYIKGREFSVGILNGKALPVIEILPVTGFYDYKNKYQKGLANEVCPAELPLELTEKVQALALKVHEVLRLGGYSRVDFILKEDSQQDGATEFYCLEANTLPGMTPISLLPQEAKAIGIGYEDLCDLIIQLAVKK